MDIQKSDNKKHYDASKFVFIDYCFPHQFSSLKVSSGRELEHYLALYLNPCFEGHLIIPSDDLFQNEGFFLINPEISFEEIDLLRLQSSKPSNKNRVFLYRKDFN
jgi:hypothetical protein